MLRNRVAALLAIIMFTAAVAGCPSVPVTPTEGAAQGGLAGAGIGAALGALIGAATGDPGTGAWVGAAAGGLLGSVAGYSAGVENQRRLLEANRAKLISPPFPNSWRGENGEITGQLVIRADGRLCYVHPCGDYLVWNDPAGKWDTEN